MILIGICCTVYDMYVAMALVIALTSANLVALHNSSSGVHRGLLYLLCEDCLFSTTESQHPVSKKVALTPAKL